MQRRSTKMKSFCFFLPSFFSFIHLPFIVPAFLSFFLSFLPSTFPSNLQTLKACHIARKRGEEEKHGPHPQSTYNFCMASRGIQQILKDWKNAWDFLWHGIHTYPMPLAFVLETGRIANFKSTRLYSRVQSGKLGVTMMDKSFGTSRHGFNSKFPEKRWMFTKGLAIPQHI